MKSCYKKVKIKFGNPPSPLSPYSTWHPKTRRPDFHLSRIFATGPEPEIRKTTRFRSPVRSAGTDIPGSAPIAQIRAVPLQRSQLRQENDDNSRIKGRTSNKLLRSCYVVNSHNVLRSVKRSRSLSPEILRHTALYSLRSPHLVRSAFDQTKVEGSHQRSVSLIPVPIRHHSRRQQQPLCSRTSQMEILARHHDEELAVVVGPDGKSTSRITQRKSFGSQLLGTSVSSRHHHQSSRANGQNSRRLLKMDIQSAPTSPTSRMGSTVPYPPYLYASQRKYPYFPVGQYRTTNSVSSSIYSEPIHSLQQQSYKQGTLPHRGGFSRPQHVSSSLFDDDPGIMSEAETSSTGFRRGGKARSSLPVVRTPSKTLERPLGLVFLQYRSETKRALLPNEITSMDTVRALFVRSFPKQLTMEYLDAMNVKIYIHDGSKDMFYELEDLRDIRDRSVLRLFEPNINGNGAVPSWDQDQSYFSEPEFDSDYQHQHIHKTKGSKTPPFMTYSYPVGATLPRVSRPYSPAPVPIKAPGGSSAPPKPQRQYPSLTKRPVVVPPNPALYSPRGAQDGRGSFPSPPSATYTTSDLRRDIYSAAEPTYISSPERRFVEDPYYAQFPPPRSGSVTPVIIDEEARVRMEHMERQLANLTGLVQKALVVQPQPPPPPTRLVHSSTLPRNIIIGANVNAPTPTAYRDYIPTRDYREDIDKHSSSSSASLPDDPVRPTAETHSSSSSVISKPPKFGKEKSVSFSDDPPDHGKQHSPTHHQVEKPTKPAIKSSTLPRMSQDRVLKAVPTPSATPTPPKQPPVPTQQQQQPPRQPNLVSIPAHPYERQYYTSPRPDLGLSPEMFNQLRILQKKAKELKGDVRVLRRSVQAQAHTVRETLRDTFLRFKVVAMAGNDQWLQGDPEKSRVHREEEFYKQEMLKLDKDLTELETTVEELRSHVINKKTRVNMSDVENMALILSKSSKSVADLKARFPSLQEGVKSLLVNEMDRLVVEERFLKEEPDRLESALKRCKKLTGTLVTLKRLASVQEQRLPSQDDQCPIGGLPPPQQQQTLPVHQPLTNNRGPGSATCYLVTPGNVLAAAGTSVVGAGTATSPENALDDLLDELSANNSSSVVSVIPQKNRLAPEPPKRLPSYPSTESGGGSPIRNWESPLKLHPPLPPKPTKIPPPPPPRTSSKSPLVSPSIESSGGESSESVNSQDAGAGTGRLSQRHQELLRKQKQLQEQYSRLQLLQQRSVSSAASNSSTEITKLELKKTGSESNLRAKLGLEFTSAPTGSLSNINKPLYETDIL